MINVPTETDVISACAAVIQATQVSGGPIKAKIIPRWILGFKPSEAVDMMQAPNEHKKVHAWVLTMQSWIESYVRSKDGGKQVPQDWTRQMMGCPAYRVVIQPQIQIIRYMSRVLLRSTKYSN